MSVGPTTGVAASVAAVGATQRGADAAQETQAAGSQQRAAQANAKADAAAGIAETDGRSHDTNERDADGRRPWEIPAKRRTSPPPDESSDLPHQSRDATGQSGGQLDLTG